MPNRAAQIRRATREARKALQGLTDEQLTRLRAAYERAALDLAAEIARYAGPNGRVGLAMLRLLRDAIERRLDQLAGFAAQLLNGALSGAAALGSLPFVAILGNAIPLLNERAVRFVQNFIAADGLQLSDRIWRLSDALKRNIGQAIESAVIQGSSASRAALDAVSNGLAVSAELAAKEALADVSALNKGVFDVLTGQDAEDYRNAERVFRTEINRAHGQAYVQSVDEDPDAAGVRFRLGRGHPRPDICDMHASANRYGLGPGVYPTSRHPWPAHPETLSYLEVVYKDEVTDEDRDGKQDRIQWLLAQPPATQESVLGKKKRAALIAGHLTEGQITTPWSVLKVRYQRLGIDVEALGK